FFFFQAEDGIRDFHVTGVQTCALPISPGTHWRAASSSGPAHTPAATANQASSAGPASSATGARSGMRRSSPYDEPSTKTSAVSRSEERRVGKECRSRWTPAHDNKNRRE